MFKRLFKPRTPTREEMMAGLYGVVADAARQPALYRVAHVPDTPLGRFEMLALHTVLIVRRLGREESEEAKRLAQEITDRFFTDVDHAQRELGIGDLGMRHRMKTMGKMYYGRLKAYGEALDRQDLAVLAEALRRNALAGAADGNARPLAAYAAEAARDLDAVQMDVLGEAGYRFPDAEAVLAAI